MNICYSTNESFAPYMAVSITSLLGNNPSLEIAVHILYSDLSDATIKRLSMFENRYKGAKIIFHKIDGARFENFGLTIEHITRETYFRYMVAEVLSDIGRVLYLDGDTIVNGDISGLFEIDLTGFYCAGVSDIHIESIGHKKTLGLDGLYINAGVILFNLDEMRRKKAAERLLKLTAENNFKYQDQDAINVAFSGKIKELDCIYNFKRTHQKLFPEKAPRAKIIHYVGPNKPWKKFTLNRLKRIYFKYLKICTEKLGNTQSSIRLFGIRIKRKNKYSPIIDKLLRIESSFNELLFDVKLNARVKKFISNLPKEYGRFHAKINKNKIYSFIIFDYDFKDSVNLYNAGDFIQSIAVKELLKKINPAVDITYIDRERLSFEKRDNLLVVMQGYFAHKTNFLPNPNLSVAYNGVHLNKKAQRYIDKLIKALPQFFKNETIGCRDLATKNFFIERGIRAYLSRCLTLALPKRKSAISQNKIYIVDLPDDIISSIPSEIRKNAIISHQRELPPIAFREDRFKCAEEILNDYRTNAKLVITSALHCASPCIAMGIPVILISLGNEPERFSSLNNIIPVYTKSDVLNGEIDFYNVSAPNIEYLKSLMFKNLSLTIKALADGTSQDTEELLKIRNEIEEYKA